MRHVAFLMVFVALFAVGCNKPQPANIQFSGHAPYYSKEKDNRSIKALCPHCGSHIKWRDTAKCPNSIAPGRKCQGVITWPDSVPCAYCKGKNVCEVCAANHRGDHKCFHCKGVGYFPPNIPCPNCNGEKACPVCKGSGKCDFCKDGQYLTDSKKAVVDPESEAEPAK
jgi:hypothetical protein